jgi:hypothetical protein
VGSRQPVRARCVLENANPVEGAYAVPSMTGTREGSFPTLAACARRAAIPIAGAVASLALHVLLLTPLLLGAAQHRALAPEAPGGSVPSRDDAAMTVVFFDDMGPRQKAPPRVSAAPVFAGVNPVVLRALQSPSLDTAFPDTASPGQRTGEPQAQGDSATFALLYGRYIGQVTARIERAWMRPRRSSSAEFACRLQVLQDERGQVLEVTVSRCSGDSRWRASLVAAVRSASPLPAPPDPHVFRRSLPLTFASAVFVPDGSTQGFEPDTLTATTAPAGRPAFATPDYLDRLRALREGRPGTVDLRIGRSQGLEAPRAPDGPARWRSGVNLSGTASVERGK